MGSQVENCSTRNGMALSRRDFMKVSAAAVAGAGALSTLGVSLHEPHEIVVSHISVVLDRLPVAFDHFRVAQLSDIHFNSFMTREHLEKVVSTMNAQKPDLVLLTGDFVTSHHRKRDLGSAEQCLHILSALQSPLGRFAVLGNHDSQVGPNAMSELIASTGVTVLRNQSHPIERNGARLHLVGVDNVTAGHARPEKAFGDVPQNECCIAAVHEPDIADELQKFSADFQMSGHSHGGQVRVPGVGAVVLPPFARKYPRGAYRVGQLQLYTNSGIGVIGLPIRFMCPPEVSIFELRTAAKMG